MPEYEFSHEILPEYSTLALNNNSWNYIYVKKHGKTIVLLSGGELTSLMWYPVVTSIEDVYSLVLIDVPPNVQDLDEIIMGIEKILLELGIELFSLIGFAFGEFIALYYALSHRDEITHLILSHTTFDGEKIRLAKKRLSVFKFMPNRLFKFLLKKKRIMTPVNTVWKDWAILYENYILDKHINKVLLVGRLNTIMQVSEIFEKLETTAAKIDVPIMILDSLDDPTYEPDKVVKHELIHNLAENVVQFVFGKDLGGHHTPIFSPAIYSTKIMEFLKDS